MRYNPTKDCSPFFEWPDPWDLKPWFKEPPKIKKKPKVRKEWEEEYNEEKQITIPYWRDIKKAGMIITEKDLHFKQWPPHRRNDASTAWLPPHHPYGERFVKVTMGFPLGWRYRDMPMNLEEVRKVQKAAEVRKKAKSKKKAPKDAKSKGKEKKPGKKEKKGKK